MLMWHCRGQPESLYSITQMDQTDRALPAGAFGAMDAGFAQKVINVLICKHQMHVLMPSS